MLILNKLGAVAPQMSDAIKPLLESPKTAQTIAGATVASGVGTWTDFIPGDIGKVATVVGICLSLTIIYVTLRREKRERLRSQLELERLRLELAEKRIHIAQQRKGDNEV